MYLHRNHQVPDASREIHIHVKSTESEDHGFEIIVVQVPPDNCNRFPVRPLIAGQTWELLRIGH